jgi:hypothetical protein
MIGIEKIHFFPALRDPRVNFQISCRREKSKEYRYGGINAKETFKEKYGPPRIFDIYPNKPSISLNP